MCKVFVDFFCFWLYICSMKITKTHTIELSAEEVAIKVFPTDEESGFRFQSFIKTHQSLIKKAMVEFAKLHVEAALKAVSENAEIVCDPYELGIQWVNTNSILNSYPLENIK